MSVSIVIHHRRSRRASGKPRRLKQMLAGALVYKSKNVEHAYLKFFKCINSFLSFFPFLPGSSASTMAPAPHWPFF